jgi:hypothetical protein
MLHVAVSVLALLSAPPDIPSLAWQPRSDWTNGWLCVESGR